MQFTNVGNSLTIHRAKLEEQYKCIKIISKSSPNALIPLRVIRTLASNCLPELMELVLDTLFRGDYEDFEGNILQSSCVNSFYAISTICTGVLQTSRMKWLIDIEPKFVINFRFPFSDFKSEIKIFHLFAGNVTQVLYENSNYPTITSEQKKRVIFDNALPHLKAFSDCILDEGRRIHQTGFNVTDDQLTILNIIRSSKFMFNRSVLHSLRAEFKKYAPKVSIDQSFLYSISTKFPRFEMDNDLPPDERDVFITSTVEHAFLLEQFQCPNDNTVRVRLYQSWIAKATLLDELSKYSTDDSKNSSWDVEELERFLDRLEAYYCSETGYLEPERALACFGYNHDERSNPAPRKYPLVSSIGNMITGISLRYIVQPFNPKDSTKNLRAIAREESSIF
jgi:hypothetical protein